MVAFPAKFQIQKFPEYPDHGALALQFDMPLAPLELTIIRALLFSLLMTIAPPFQPAGCALIALM